MYAKMATATTRDIFTKSISTLMIVPGNSIGRSCHTIRAETANAIIIIRICFQFMAYLHVEIASVQNKQFLEAVFAELLPVGIPLQMTGP
jgi:hypothetical protein